MKDFRQYYYRYIDRYRKRIYARNKVDRVAIIRSDYDLCSTTKYRDVYTIPKVTCGSTIIVHKKFNVNFRLI